MSYDLMVFKNEAAPKSRSEFIAWYHAQTKWEEGHSYDDPSITAPELQSWLSEMVLTFPDMNGPDVTGEQVDSDHEAGYTIGRDVIYVDFRWSVAGEAYETVRRLAEKHQVGFFDASGSEGILLPANGVLKPLEQLYQRDQSSNKPWWKFW